MVNYIDKKYILVLMGFSTEAEITESDDGNWKKDVSFGCFAIASSSLFLFLSFCEPDWNTRFIVKQ